MPARIERRSCIPHDTQRSATPVVEPQNSVPVPKKSSARFLKAWGGRTFRFNIRSFRPGDDSTTRRFSIVEAALLIMLALLASRALGVIRQVIFNALFGTGLEANAYVAAARLPDTLFNLIAGGTLTHALIPVFFSYEKKHGDIETWRLASLVFNLLFVALTLIIIVGEFLTPAFVNQILVPGFSPAGQALTTSLTRILLFEPLILGVGSVVSAVLSSKRQFLLPALSLAMYNFGVIGGLVVTLLIPRVGVYGLTVGVLVAVTLQLAVQIPALVKQGARYEFIWNLRHPGLLEVLRLLIPNALATGVAYVATIVDTNFASRIPDLASVSALQNAEMLQGLPAALISQAIAQSLLPHLTVQAASGRYVRMRQTALKVIGGAALLTVPAALVLAALGKPLIHLLFQHGAFNQHSTDVTALALLGYAVALPGMSLGSLLAGGFFALKDSTTPFFANTVGLIVHVGLLFLFFTMLPVTLMVMAIPLALGGSTTVESLLLVGLLLFRLRKRIPLDKGMLRLLRRRQYEQDRKLDEVAVGQGSEKEH